MTAEISFHIRIDGGDADEGRVNLYDAGHTITGLARCVNLVAHAFANEEDVRTKSDNPTDVKSYLHASKKGCFEERVDVEFGSRVIKKMGKTVIPRNFWDYLLWSWSASVGKSYEPTTSYVRKLDNSELPFADEIADALQSPMNEFHRVIATSPESTISLSRLRDEDAITFDLESLQYLKATRLTPPTYAYGNVTKYNILSGNGRYFDDQRRSVLSFHLVDNDKKPNDQAIAVRSMEHRVRGDEGKVRFRGRHLLTERGTIKRFLVDAIELEKL
jgi:hypothetical protein